MVVFVGFCFGALESESLDDELLPEDDDDLDLQQGHDCWLCLHSFVYAITCLNELQYTGNTLFLAFYLYTIDYGQLK